MLIPIFILISALLVLVVMYVLDDALRVMNERAGLPAGSGMRWSKRIVWVVLALVVAQFFVPQDLFEPPPPQQATYGPDSLWTGADTTRIDPLWTGADPEHCALPRPARHSIARHQWHELPELPSRCRHQTVGQQLRRGVEHLSQSARA
jgi:hypothetical protein